MRGVSSVFLGFVLVIGVGLLFRLIRDGSAQVFLEASGNPLSLEEFIGFCRFYLL